MRHFWLKAAGLAVSAATAFAMFGGGAVHTQFSAPQSANATIQGAYVATGLTSTYVYNITSDDGHGNFTCSSLVPGAAPGNNWGSPGDPGFPGWCQETLIFQNTGNVDETFTLSTSGPIQADTTPAIYNWGDLGELLFSVSPGTPSGTYAYAAAGDTWTFGSVAKGNTLSVNVFITLASGAGNEWNNAQVVVPYTVTATAGS